MSATDIAIALHMTNGQRAILLKRADCELPPMVMRPPDYFPERGMNGLFRTRTGDAGYFCIVDTKETHLTAKGSGMTFNMKTGFNTVLAAMLISTATFATAPAASAGERDHRHHGGGMNNGVFIGLGVALFAATLAADQSKGKPCKSQAFAKKDAVAFCSKKLGKIAKCNGRPRRWICR